MAGHCVQGLVLSICFNALAQHTHQCARARRPRAAVPPAAQACSERRGAGTGVQSPQHEACGEGMEYLCCMCEAS